MCFHEYLLFKEEPMTPRVRNSLGWSFALPAGPGRERAGEGVPSPGMLSDSSLGK